MLLLCMNILCSSSYAQNKYVLKGVVIDENNQSLTGASVFLYPIKKGTITDDVGKFVINNLQKGNYIIEISFIGYNTFVDTLKISRDETYKAQLKVTALSLQEVVVTDNYVETQKKEESLNIEIVNNDYLKQNLGGSLMKSLERLPGVSTIDIGSGQSKPVIRGLSFNRVVVVENGIKHEGQQWGADHGLEIDQYAINNVKVIKGPASLMYGSDAIGGVIDMKNKRIPAENSFGGTVDLSGKTNNNFLGTSIALYGRKKWFFADFRATILDYGDYKVPTDSIDIYSYRAALYKRNLRNTAGKEQNLHFSFGIVKPKWQSRFYISNIHSKSGFFANAHGLEPRSVNTELHDKSKRDINFPHQEVNHFKIINTSHFQWGKMKLESDLGFQRNFRQEKNNYTPHGWMPSIFPDTLSFGPELEKEFDKYIYSANIKLKYQKDDNSQFVFGINSDYQNNNIDGGIFLIPAYRLLNVGGFAFAKYALSEKSMLQMGVRYDYGNINSSEYHDWFLTPVVSNSGTTWQHLKRAKNANQNFSNFSWSVGYTYYPEQWLLKVNVGKSFRMPLSGELFADGVNFPMFRYEVGNADLSPEISYQLDLGVEYSSKAIVIGLSPFLNYFSNYIYLNPTSEHNRDYGAGYQVFEYRQSKVFRYGAEVHAHYQILKPLQLGIIGEYVYSEQLSGEKKGFTLPFSPPASVIFNIKYQKRKTKFIENAYLSLDYKITAAQNNIVPPEEITNGYQVINLGLGGDINLRNQNVNISLQVQNLLNNKYFNHTSYYRLINVPEPGRNYIVNITIPFSGKIKNK